MILPVRTGAEGSASKVQPLLSPGEFPRQGVASERTVTVLSAAQLHGNHLDASEDAGAGPTPSSELVRWGCGIRLPHRFPDVFVPEPPLRTS